MSHRYSQTLSFLLSLITFLATSEGARACDEKPAGAEQSENDEMLTYLLGGWLAEREKIQWAHYVAEGGFAKDQVDPSVSGPFTIEARLSVGVERYESKWAEKLGWAASWLQYEDHVVSWQYGGGKTAIVGIDPSDKRDRRMCARIDPRHASFKGISSWPEASPQFREFAKVVLYGYAAEQVDQVGPHIYEVFLKPRGLRSTTTRYLTKLRINDARGFSIERMELYHQRPDQPSPGDCVGWTNSTWEEIQSVWIPTRVEGEAKSHTPNGLEVVRNCWVTFKWISINQELPPEVFDPADFKVADGQPIVDYRLANGKGSQVGRIDRSKPRDPKDDGSKSLDRFLKPNVNAPIPPADGSAMLSPRVIVILAINVLLFCSLVVIWRRQRARPTRVTKGQ